LDQNEFIEHAIISSYSTGGYREIYQIKYFSQGIKEEFFNNLINTALLLRNPKNDEWDTYNFGEYKIFNFKDYLAISYISRAHELKRHIFYDEILFFTKSAIGKFNRNIFDLKSFFNCSKDYYEKTVIEKPEKIKLLELTELLTYTTPKFYENWKSLVEHILLIYGKDFLADLFNAIYFSNKIIFLSAESTIQNHNLFRFLYYFLPIEVLFKITLSTCETNYDPNSNLNLAIIPLNTNLDKSIYDLKYPILDLKKKEGVNVRNSQLGKIIVSDIEKNICSLEPNYEFILEMIDVIDEFLINNDFPKWIADWSYVCTTIKQEMENLVLKFEVFKNQSSQMRRIYSSVKEILKTFFQNKKIPNYFSLLPSLQNEIKSIYIKIQQRKVEELPRIINNLKQIFDYGTINPKKIETFIYGFQITKELQYLDEPLFLMLKNYLIQIFIESIIPKEIKFILIFPDEYYNSQNSLFVRLLLDIFKSRVIPYWLFNIESIFTLNYEMQRYKEKYGLQSSKYGEILNFIEQILNFKEIIYIKNNLSDFQSYIDKLSNYFSLYENDLIYKSKQNIYEFREYLILELIQGSNLIPKIYNQLSNLLNSNYFKNASKIEEELITLILNYIIEPNKFREIKDKILDKNGFFRIVDTLTSLFKKFFLPLSNVMEDKKEEISLDKTLIENRQFKLIELIMEYLKTNERPKKMDEKESDFFKNHELLTEIAKYYIEDNKVALDFVKEGLENQDITYEWKVLLEGKEWILEIGDDLNRIKANNVKEFLYNEIKDSLLNRQVPEWFKRLIQIYNSLDGIKNIFIGLKHEDLKDCFINSLYNGQMDQKFLIYSQIEEQVINLQIDFKYYSPLEIIEFQKILRQILSSSEELYSLEILIKIKDIVFSLLNNINKTIFQFTPEKLLNNLKSSKQNINLILNNLEEINFVNPFDIPENLKIIKEIDSFFVDIKSIMEKINRIGKIENKEEFISILIETFQSGVLPLSISSINLFKEELIAILSKLSDKTLDPKVLEIIIKCVQFGYFPTWLKDIEAYKNAIVSLTQSR